MTRRLLALAGVVAAIAAVFIFVVRPWYLNWGATNEERSQILVGDAIVADAGGQQTRAITIEAPVDRVWPWLAQLGQDRGGFYSFDVLENVVGCEMPTLDVLRPDKQSWAIGDKLWMYPPEKAGGIGFATLRAFVPGRAMAFGTHVAGTPIAAPEDGSWSFVLVPIDASTTRFIVRGRGATGRSLLGQTFDRSIFEPAHFAMERRMMIGLKEVAEGLSRRRSENHAQVALWTITFGLFLATGVLVLVRERWGSPLVGFVASAIVFQILTLGQPPLVIGIALTGGLVAFVAGWFAPWPFLDPHVVGTARRGYRG